MCQKAPRLQKERRTAVCRTKLFRTQQKQMSAENVLRRYSTSLKNLQYLGATAKGLSAAPVPLKIQMTFARPGIFLRKIFL